MALPRICFRAFSPMRSSLCRLDAPCINATLRPLSFSARKQGSNTAPKTTNSPIELAKPRRKIYQLGKNGPVPDSKIEELVNAAILNVSSSFNTQSTRLLVLLHCAVPEQVWQKQTLPKLQWFKAGTLFCEDPAHIKPFSEKFSLYKEHFQPWADRSNAMHQYLPWTGLESRSLGANLQHYNPLIDAPVANRWNIPREWRLVAQLVFET
ncbi:Nitroreductase-like protein [Aspergillus egyptiacus]|nr:Nitroreductase-like protein [Aspergillus egyptiacus]